MAYFIFYDDDYPDNDGVGLHKEDTEYKAISFIENRIADNSSTIRETSNYTLIEGRELSIEEVEVVKKIKIGR